MMTMMLWIMVSDFYSQILKCVWLVNVSGETLHMVK